MSSAKETNPCVEVKFNPGRGKSLPKRPIFPPLHPLLQYGAGFLHSSNSGLVLVL